MKKRIICVSQNHAPLKLSIGVRQVQALITPKSVWSAAPDDLPERVVNQCLSDLSMIFDCPDEHDIALHLIKPRPELDMGRYIDWPTEAIRTDPDEIYPDHPNLAINGLIARQIDYVRTAMKTKKLSQADIPTSENTNSPDLLIPPWFFQPKLVAGLEKSVRMRAFEALPELKRCHTAELDLANANTSVFMETGWNPTAKAYPTPRSVRESTELQRLVESGRKAELVLGFCDPYRLRDGFMVPQWTQDANAWENPSLTLPEVSWGFYAWDERRRIPSLDIDSMDCEVQKWLRGGPDSRMHTGEPHYESGWVASEAVKEIIYKMRNRDGLYRGVYGEIPTAVGRLNGDAPIGWVGRGRPSAGVGNGLVVSTEGLDTATNRFAGRQKITSGID